MSDQDDVLGHAKTYFHARIVEFGGQARGVDWNSPFAQEIRFEQILRVVDPSTRFSILDYGCGYGALIDYMEKKGWQFDYVGYDILPSMIEAATQQYGGKPGRTFTTREDDLPVVDYVVASGTFNYRGGTAQEPWKDMVMAALTRFDRLSRKGFSSNFLTKYSDADRMRDDLYYADPLFLFDHAKRNFSRNVAILHDYEIYDFTLIVRKTPAP